MTKKTHTIQPARAIALAFVIIGAAFVVAPQAEAQCAPNQLVIPEDQLVTKKGQAATTRLVTVGQNGGPEIGRVDFLMPRTNPMQWVWEYSSAHGWDVEVNNAYTAEHALLRFTATDPRFNIQDSCVPGVGSPTVDFVIAFNTYDRAPDPEPGQPAFKYDDIQVYGFRSGVPPTVPGQVSVWEDTERPKILPAGAITLDRDRDGHLDGMLLSFNEILDPRSFNFREFEVPGYTVDYGYITNLAQKTTPYVPADDLLIVEYPWYGDCPIDPLNVMHGCTQIMLELVEGAMYDTGAMPQIRASSTTLADYAGNRLARANPVVIDGAAPMLVSALASNADDDFTDYEILRVRFTEDVQWSNHPMRDPDSVPAGSEACLPQNNLSRCVIAPRTAPTASNPSRHDDRVSDPTFCPREPDHWRLLPQAFDYNDTASSGATTQATGSRVIVQPRAAETGPGCPPPIGQNLQDWIQHPPCWRDDNECDPDEYLSEPKKPGDLSWADIYLATPLKAADVAVGSADLISCGRMESQGQPSEGHIRDLGNGGDLYWDVATFPLDRQVDPTLGHDGDVKPPNEPGLGMRCDPNRKVDVELARMVEAQTDIWRNWTDVRFNWPVALYDPEEPTSAEALDVQSFDVITTNAGGPRGIINVLHVPCTDTVRLYFRQAQKVLPTDVDDTPTYIRSAADRIRACATGVDELNEYDTIQILPVAEVPLTDLERPRILEAHTMDQDSNGIVDSYFLKWSEPVRDSSYCSGLNPCPRQKAIDLADRNGERALDLATGGNVWSRYGPFHFDTDKLVDDDEVIIRWEEAIVESCSSDCDRGPGHPDAIHSGVVPDLQVSVDLFEDLVPETTTGAVYPWPNVNVDQSGPQFFYDRNTRVDVRELDRAPPVVWQAQTVDREVDLRLAANDGECRMGGEAVCPADPDGMLDGYRITFSESVQDFFGDDTDDYWSFRPDNFKVEGYKVTGARLENRVGDGFFDSWMVLDIDERPELRGDTDARPELTYDLVNATVNPFRGLIDFAGNLLQPFGVKDVQEEDDARPAIWAVEGFVGSTQLNVTFSEPVDDGSGKPVVRRDLTYANGNQEQGVAGFAISERSEPGLGPDPAEVVHEPGSKFAVVPLEGPLTQGDVDLDKVAAFVNSIREVSPTVEDKKFILNNLRGLGHAADVSPPCAIDEITADRITANSVRIAWVAPDEDCVLDPSRGGTVSGYRFAIRNETFSTSSIFRGQNDYDTFELTVDLATVANGLESLGGIATPGNTQSAIVVGLAPRSSYFIQVTAVDDAGNVGPPGHGPLGVTTLDDITPPVPMSGFTGLVVTSETHKQGVPTLNRRAAFKWDGMEDPESTVVYRYALNEDPDYQVVRGDTSVQAKETSVSAPGDGNWYFHVRAFSAGGPAPSTAHYHLRIGAVQLSEADLVACDQEANENLEVIRKGGKNRLEWELPDCAANLASSERNLVAIWIWRLDPGFDHYQAVKVQPGDYTALKEFSFIDPDGNPALRDSKYALQLEFASGTDTEAAGQRSQDPTPQDVPGVTPVSQDPGQIPEWIWIVLGVALALVIAGLVIFFVLRGRDRQDAASTAAGYQWEEIGGGPSGVDKASGLPIHDIQCPSCATQFQALGHTPLEVTCPNCRISGTLD